MKTSYSLITGCAGFVGSNLTRALLEQGHHVVGVDNYSSGLRGNIEDFEDSSRFHFLNDDFSEQDFLSDVFDAYPVSKVFHLAAIVSVPFSIQHPKRTIQQNYEAADALRKSSQAAGVDSFVFAGSAAEYGNDQRLPLKEEYATSESDHESPYGLAKFKTTERIIQDNYGCSLRFFNIFGPNQNPTNPYSGVISIFIDRCLRGKDIIIHGDGCQTRDFIYVSDAIDAYLIASGIKPRAKPLSGVYNVARGKATSILSIAHKIVAITGSNSRIIHIDPREGDIKHSVADIDKITEHTKFNPKTPLTEGLEKTIFWYERTNAVTKKHTRVPL